MAATNLTPRQKMINMLYLVLTAILALNVSSDVLNAFKTVNDGIDISNNSQQKKNEGTYSQLSKQYSIDPKRAKEAYEKGEKAKVLTTRLNNLLEQYKQQMIKEAGGIDPETGKIKRDDDIDIATRMFVENSANGKDLKKQITDTRAQLLALLNDQERSEADKSLALKIDEPATKGTTWEYAKFNHVPVVAAVTLLTKYQNDVLSAEGHIAEALNRSVNGDETTTVDKMEAKVISLSSYVLQGEQYKADVMVAASSSTLVPEVFLGSFTSSVIRTGGGFNKITSESDALPLTNPVKIDVENGLGKLSMPGAATGNRKYTGVIRTKNSSTGKYEFYPFEGEYQVAPKTAVVSPKKMNVLYIGLDNPVDISVPGVAQSDVTAEVVGSGSLVKSADGSYNAKVTQPGALKIVVKAKVNSKIMSMGEQQFRVKRVPDPVTTLDGTYEGGRITPAKIKSTRGVVPQLKDFVYDTRFIVVSYEVVYRSKKDGILPPIKVDGPIYNQKAKDVITRAESGDAIFLDNILVKGPAGDIRKINPIAFDVTK